MKQETQILLSLPNLPGRVCTQECAEILGFNVEALHLLIRSKWLRPLGRQRPGGVKMFSAVEIRALAANRAWLSRATDLVSDSYAKKNADAKNRRRLGASQRAPAA